MKLITRDGLVVMVHFQHKRVETKLWDWQSSATVHKGPCQLKERPCGTESVVGIAYSSRKDHFNRAEGRKLALTRALVGFAKPLRAELWAAYLAVYIPEAK